LGYKNKAVIAKNDNGNEINIQFFFLLVNYVLVYLRFKEEGYSFVSLYTLTTNNAIVSFEIIH